MLNRTELSSQGAKARRLLLEAMITANSEDKLGLDGYGPEMAMYLATLKTSGVHHLDARHATWTLGPPKRDLQDAWSAIDNEFKRARDRRVNLRDLYATLLSPPIGMKHGAIPVVLTAALLVARDDVAIYEHGTFRPALTPELSERMVRNPEHFEIKHYGSSSGARRALLEALDNALGSMPQRRKQRVPQVLGIVGQLVTRLNALPDYVRRTAHLPETVLGVRDALLNAVEPDQLVFADLPQILGYPTVDPKPGSCAFATELAEQIGEAMRALEAAYPALLTDLTRSVLDATSERTRSALAGQAESLEGEVLHPELQAFVNALATHTLQDDEWVEYIGMVVAAKAPGSWTDADTTRFHRVVFERGGAFRRLLALRAERHARDGVGFDAVRLTMTRGDGSEDARLVAIAVDDRDEVASRVDELLSGLTTLMDSREQARQGVLAVLAEQLLAESDHHTVLRTEATAPDTRSKVNHG
jgi:hypothetical protein